MRASSSRWLELNARGIDEVAESLDRRFLTSALPAELPRLGDVELIVCFVIRLCIPIRLHAFRQILQHELLQRYQSPCHCVVPSMLAGDVEKTQTAPLPAIEDKLRVIRVFRVINPSSCSSQHMLSRSLRFWPADGTLGLRGESGRWRMFFQLLCNLLLLLAVCSEVDAWKHADE